MTDANNEPNAERLFKNDATIVPPSSPPEFRQLTKRVALLRRRRRVVRSLAASAAVVVGLLFVATWRNSDQLNDSAARLAADANGQSADPPAKQTNEQIVQDNSAPVAPVERVKSSGSPKIQLYASVSQSVPVFDFDEQSKTIHHVGWVESQHDVPVDMSFVSENQQDTFNAVLHQAGDWHFSL
ncbi:MAG: hypothetical protein WBD20_09025 [Pirellulaceae bacterium]